MITDNPPPTCMVCIILTDHVILTNLALVCSKLTTGQNGDVDWCSVVFAGGLFNSSKPSIIYHDLNVNSKNHHVLTED